MTPPSDYVIEVYPEPVTGTDIDSTRPSKASGKLTFSTILSHEVKRLPVSDAMIREAGGEMGSAEILAAH
jgi:hypothetical protein